MTNSRASPAARSSDRYLVASIQLTRRETAVGLLIAVFVALAVVAVPYNLVTVEDTTFDTDRETVEVRDYTVLYAEDIPDRYVGAYDLPIVNTTGVTSSGVVVASGERGIWWEAVSKSRLAFSGTEVVKVGGVGWEQRVVANRSGWSAAGGPKAYKVYLGRGGDSQRLAFVSENATADPTIQGRNVTVAPVDEGFELVVTRGNESLGRTAIPVENETRSVGGLGFVRDGKKVYATANGTRVEVASKETYNGG
jgi:hypothetical protein